MGIIKTVLCMVFVGSLFFCSWKAPSPPLVLLFGVFFSLGYSAGGFKEGVTAVLMAGFPIFGLWWSILPKM